MSLSTEADCPECGHQEFYKAASMSTQLGRKEKWHCPGCEYGFVTVGEVDTSETR